SAVSNAAPSPGPHCCAQTSSLRQTAAAPAGTETATSPALKTGWSCAAWVGDGQERRIPTQRQSRGLRPLATLRVILAEAPAVNEGLSVKRSDIYLTAGSPSTSGRRRARAR